MTFLFLFCSLMFVVQIITNIILIVKFIPKRDKKQKVNISDLMNLASQIIGGNDESV